MLTKTKSKTKTSKKTKSKTKTKVLCNNIFDLLPESLIIKIIHYIPIPKNPTDIKNWFRLYWSWSLASKSNWAFFNNMGLKAIPINLRDFLPRLKYTAEYPHKNNDEIIPSERVSKTYIITTRLTRNGSYFQARMMFAIYGNHLCVFCSCKSNESYTYFQNNSYEYVHDTSDSDSEPESQTYRYSREIGAICFECYTSRFVSIRKFLKIMKSPELDTLLHTTDRIGINISHSKILVQQVLNETVDERCLRIRSLGYSDCIRDLTFNDPKQIRVLK